MQGLRRTFQPHLTMGLAGVKVKQRFGLDPRNTLWSNDTARFGHQYLQKMGWRPGSGLGLVHYATTSHVKMSVKTDNAGLGARLAKEKPTAEFDSGECARLDVFQRILGRLNGNQAQVECELNRRHTETVMGKYGMHFVPGEVLESTWNAARQQLTAKRSSGDDEPSPKRSRTEKAKEKEEKVKKKEERDKKKNKKDKTEKKDKKDRKDKKERKDKKQKNMKEQRQEENDKKKRKAKKEKEKEEKMKKKGKKALQNTVKEKKLKDLSEEKNLKFLNPVYRDEMLQPSSNTSAIATRLSARSKWIKQKRASVMDAKALDEIFMIKNQSLH